MKMFMKINEIWMEVLDIYIYMVFIATEKCPL